MKKNACLFSVSPVFVELYCTRIYRHTYVQRAHALRENVNNVVWERKQRRRLNITSCWTMNMEIWFGFACGLFSRIYCIWRKTFFLLNVARHELNKCLWINLMVIDIVYTPCLAIESNFRFNSWKAMAWTRVVLFVSEYTQKWILWPESSIIDGSSESISKYLSNHTPFSRKW